MHACWHRTKRCFMKSTSPRNFRANLKEYMKMAAAKPVLIQKREGIACILMSELYMEWMIVLGHSTVIIKDYFAID